MAPTAPPRFQAPIESPEQARERTEIELVARSTRARRRPGDTDGNDTPPDVPVGVQQPTMENP